MLEVRHTSVNFGAKHSWPHQTGERKYRYSALSVSNAAGWQTFHELACRITGTDPLTFSRTRYRSDLRVRNGVGRYARRTSAWTTDTLPHLSWPNLHKLTRQASSTNPSSFSQSKKIESVRAGS